MSDDNEPGREIETYVRKGDDGEQRVINMVPFTPGPFPGSPVVAGGPPHIQMMVLALGGDGEPGELRHLSYDDPPGMPGAVSPEVYREMLGRAAHAADDEQEFCQMMVMVLGKDLVLAHGCDPHVAIPAIVEFARKVYAEHCGSI